MSRFDALQPSASDTFDRAAAVVRAGRPRRSQRPLALAVALAVALVVAVGACVAPVESDDLVGFAVEWTAYGSVGPGHHTMQAIDAVVPVLARVSVETRTAERPNVPPGHAWPASGSWTRVRYTTHTVRRADADAWADTLRALVGAYNVRVDPVVRRDRQPLVAVALGRVGQAVSSSPELSDRDLQALLDVAADPHADESMRHRVERLADGRRIMRQGRGFGIVLDPEVRIWLRPDAEPSQRITFEGVASDRLLVETADGWRPVSEMLR